MRRSLLPVALVCIAAGPSAARDQPAPKEENCSKAIEAGLNNCATLHLI